LLYALFSVTAVLQELQRRMIYRFDQFELDIDLFELREAGEPVALEPKAFDLLRCLIENRDRVVSRDELIERVWNGRIVSDSTLSTAVKHARSAIGDDGAHQRLIQTSHGRGFRFVGELEATTPDASAKHAAESQEIRYCRTRDGVEIAYATTGKGSTLIKAANWMSHLEYDWESPIWRHWIEGLSQHHRLVRYDERGNGLSDREVDDLSFESWVADLETVVDAASADRFALLGISKGCAVSVEYAIRHPERVSHLILYGGYVKGWRKRADPDEIQQREAMSALIRVGWGQDNPAFRQLFTSLFMPGASREQANWFNELQRKTATPEVAARLHDESGYIDVTDRLAKIEVPTLVLHARRDAVIPLKAGRAFATGIPNASFISLDSDNHILLQDEPAFSQLITAINHFLEEDDDRD
jgi:DNA-binding winged helix-turn-helix (wHTH) protein/pimeloyl-ACP methyl ester carboxylesterase